MNHTRAIALVALLTWLAAGLPSLATAAERYRTSLPTALPVSTAIILTASPRQAVALPATVTTDESESTLEAALPRGATTVLPVAILTDGSVITRPAAALATTSTAATEREIADLTKEIATLSEKLTALQQRRAALPTQGENQ